MTNTKVGQPAELSKETVAAAIAEYCERRGISQSDLATQAAVSTATISKMVNGKWDDIRDAMWRKVWHVVADSALQMLVATADHSAVQQMCKLSRERCLMVGLVGDTGMGKTTSLKVISRQRNTYYVCFDKTMKARQFFIAVLREMGIPFEGTLHEMVARIADELNTQAGPLLLIDEAGKLTHNVMLYMHVLRDKTARNAGIVLAGMPYFKTNLQRSSNKQKEGCAEFLRRINVWHQMEGLTRQEIAFICEQQGITDRDTVRAMSTNKRFGDLMNAVLLASLNTD